MERRLYLRLAGRGRCTARPEWQAGRNGSVRLDWGRSSVTKFVNDRHIKVDPWFRHHLNRTERDATATREAGVNFE